MKDYRLLLALVAVALIWGTTFLGIRVAVETISPWFVAGFRQLLAGVILAVILLFQKKLKWIGWKNLRIQITLSILMLIVANGLVTVAETRVTSSLASLISASSPLLIFIGSVLLGLQKFTVRSLVGVLLGFSGIVFIFWDGLKDLMNPDYRFGISLMLIAIFGWAAGTIYSKKINYKSDNIFLNLFYQFLFAGIAQLILAVVFKENLIIQNWSLRSISAMIYLAVFGSVAAFFAFNYALTKVTATQVSLLSYINTIIAITLGWLLLDEPISTKFIIAAVLIISGVFITNYSPDMFRRKK